MNFTSYLVAAGLLAATANVQAQGLAEDFGSNPYLLEFFTDNLGAESDGVIVSNDGTTLIGRATTDDDNRGKIQFTPIQRDVTQLSVTAAMNSETQFDPDVPGRARIYMQGYFYNDTQDNGLGDEERTGDSRISLEMNFRNDGSADVVACFDRRDSDGNKSVQPGADVNNGEKCTEFATIPQFDLTHTLTIGYDEASSKVYALFDDERIEHVVTTGQFITQSPSSEIMLRVEGTSTTGVASFHSITVNNVSVDDLSEFAEAPKYKNPNYNNGNDIVVADGKLRLAIASDGSNPVETNREFRALGETNYIEAKIMLSSESTLTETGTNIARLRNTFYNEAQDGGTGDDGLGNQTSDVFASLSLFMKENREVVADVSVTRADNGNYSESTLLSNDPEVLYPILMEGLALDTEYTASIEMDRDAKQLIFKFEDAEHVFNIQSEIYTAAYLDGAGVDARIRGAGKTVVFADDFRTNPNAKTNEELSGSNTSTGGDTGTTAASSGGGGGCSVGATGSSMGFMFLMAGFIALLRLRRRGLVVQS